MFLKILIHLAILGSWNISQFLTIVINYFCISSIHMHRNGMVLKNTLTLLNVTCTKVFAFYLEKYVTFSAGIKSKYYL